VLGTYFAATRCPLTDKGKTGSRFGQDTSGQLFKCHYRAMIVKTEETDLAEQNALHLNSSLLRRIFCCGLR
jgi:hypothetical protein